MDDAAIATEGLIQHVSELPAYSPPAHSGTVNRRLVGRDFRAEGAKPAEGSATPPPADTSAPPKQ